MNFFYGEYEGELKNYIKHGKGEINLLMEINLKENGKIIWKTVKGLFILKKEING
jgi:hypothetical protein